ncbi:MAG: hypothetical protein FRX48_08687 [Lasallia pustulata]|uniref:Uncharacterized protein n=1 Tax=Lasallia pustulata TaxID=136370 RepID=A0A5M8PEV8_9LECA|nr:MAG: hypothetical protein FRX48_08687 [Lasallia pustulata]
MAKRCGKVYQFSDSTEIPLSPYVFQVTSSEPMPMEPPNTSSLTAMPELFGPTIIAGDVDWRQHPKWKPLLSTPSRSTPIPKGTLVPDPSPVRTVSDGETSTLMDPSPAGSYTHRRRQGEYVHRPPVWNLNGLGVENSSPFLAAKDLGCDTAGRDEDIPFPFKVATNLPANARHFSKSSLAVSQIKLPSYCWEDQLSQMATAFTTDPCIANMAQDITYTNLSMLEASTERAIIGPIIQQWVRSTPPPQEEGIKGQRQRRTTGSCVGPSGVNASYAGVPPVSDQGGSGFEHLGTETPVESAGTAVPSVGQVVGSDSDGGVLYPGDSASAFGADGNGNRHRAPTGYSTENHHVNRYFDNNRFRNNRFRDIRTAPPVQEAMEYVHWISVGSRVTCVDATSIVSASAKDDQFELKLGHQYLISRIFDDQWALCIRYDIHENLQLHQGKLGKSISKKIMHTLRLRPKKSTDLSQMAKVEYDRSIINFLPLCAVTDEANYGAYLGVSGSTSTTTDSSSSGTMIRASLRSPSEGGVVQAPERISSRKEAVKIRKAGFVEVPEHIFIASQVGPHKDPHLSVHAVRNGLREDLVPMQHPDGRDTAKQPFITLGRFMGTKTIKGKKAWKDATQRLRKGKSFGDLLGGTGNAAQRPSAAQAFQTGRITNTASFGGLLERTGNATQPQSAAQAFQTGGITNTASFGGLLERTGNATQGQSAAQASQTRNITNTASEDRASDVPSNELSSQAPVESFPRATDRAKNASDNSREPLLSPNSDSITAMGTSHDGTTDTVQQSASVQSSLSVEGTIRADSWAATTDLEPSPQDSFTLRPPAIADLPAIAPTSTTPPTTNLAHEAPIASVEHVESIGERDSFFDLTWGVVEGVADPPIPLPR